MASLPIELKVASRDILRGRHDGTFLTFYIPTEHKNGYVFVLADIDPTCQATATIVALLREQLELLANGLDAESHLQHRFEQSLHVINAGIAQLIEDEQCPPESLHILVGIVHEQSFVMSAVGSLHAVFLRKTAKQRFRMFDLSTSLQTERGNIKSEKVFSVVLDGALQPNDVFLVGSRQLHSLLNLEELHPLISTLPPAGALETIEQYVPARGALSLLLIQVRRQKDLITGYGPEVTSERSLQALADTREETESILEHEQPHIIRAVKKFFASIKAGSRLEQREHAKAISRWIWNAMKAAGMYFLLVLNNVAVSCVSLAVAIFSKPSKRARAIQQAKDVWKKTLTPTKGVAREAAVSGKFLIIGAIVFIALFGASTMFFKNQQKKEAQAQAFQEQMTRVSELRDTAEASIIYQDDRIALENLNTAEQILDSLELVRSEDQPLVDEQRAGILAARNQVRRVQDPDVKATAFQQSSVVSANQNTLLFNDGTIQHLSGTDAPSALESLSSPAVLSVPYQDATLVLSQSGDLSLIAAGASTATSIGINSAEGELTDVRAGVHYGERLYFLTSSMIYRHQRVENGEYGPANSWLSDPADLSQAQSFAVDGSIWLGGEGTLQRFEQGQEIGADVSSIDPPLGTVRHLWTSPDTDLLFILDSTEGRVVIYNKESGRMLAQYLDNRFKDALAFWIDLDTSQASIVIPSHLLTFPLTAVVQ